MSVSVSVCLCAFVSVLSGPAGASQAEEMRLHAPTHKEREKADIDLWQDKLLMPQHVAIHYLYTHNS